MASNSQSGNGWKFSPEAAVGTIALYVKAFVQIAIWLVVAGATGTGLFLIARLLWWAIKHTLAALSI